MSAEKHELPTAAAAAGTPGDEPAVAPAAGPTGGPGLARAWKRLRGALGVPWTVDKANVLRLAAERIEAARAGEPVERS